jgi:xylulose-5-phosphate/fructose-6-phosphate phosphoketolase
MAGQRSETQLGRMQAYWDAANYLVVGQTHLQDNPLLREPLEPAHLEPRVLGHRVDIPEIRDWVWTD